MVGRDVTPGLLEIGALQIGEAAVSPFHDKDDILAVRMHSK